MRTFENIKFLDDFTVLNDGSEFERSFKKIYPPELELKKKNDIKTKGSFLDLGIKIRDNRF